MKKYDFLMFIDDDEPTNVYHEIVLNDSALCEAYIFFESPLKALDYLRKAQTDESVKIPDAIFLDINMPKMNGWQFLDEYERIGFDKSSIVFMLTTSLNTFDKNKAKEYQTVQQMINKPLTKEVLEHLYDRIMKPN